jgi:hypothetical protein
MPVFTLPELATIAGKDQTTMRRWFDLGFFGDAGFRTVGRQRRVRASSAEKAVAAARLGAKGYERQSPSKEEKLMREMAKAERRMNKTQKKIAEVFDVLKLDRQARAVSHLVGRTTHILLEQTDEQLQSLGLNPAGTFEAVWEMAVSADTIRVALVSSLSLWMRKVGSTSPSALAGAIGISRRTLSRRLGCYLAQAGRLSRLNEQNRENAAKTQGFDYKANRNIPVTLVVHKATRSELRQWASACNYRQRNTSAPSLSGNDTLGYVED